MGGSARNQGNQADYVLGTAEGWDAFGVVRWHGVEEIGRPYRYDITLQRTASKGPVDLDELLDTAATFQIASQGKWRPVHGILGEAEEIDRTKQIILYRVLLVPHFWRARYRRRCRNFHEKSLVDIVSAVLENRSPDHPQGPGGLTRFSQVRSPDAQPSFAAFTPPTASYRWEVRDKPRAGGKPRVEDPHVRPYVVQYNESDFAFVSRLLGDEEPWGFAHTTSVGGDQTNVVSGSQKNQVEGARTHTVGGDEHVTVNRDRTTHFKLNEHHTVDVSRDTHIHASELHEVDVYRKTRIGGNDDLEVKGWRNAVVESGDTIDVRGQRHVEVRNVLYTKGHANIESDSDAAHLFTSKSARFELTEEFVVNVKGCELRMTPGNIYLKNGTGQAIILTGGNVTITGAAVCTIDGTAINIHGEATTVDAGKAATLSGNTVKIAGTAIDLGPK